jgi:hypothetical protein
LLSESLKLARELGDQFGLAWALILQGQMLYNHDVPEQAQPMFEEGLTLAIRQREYELICLGLTGLAHVLVARGQPAGAARLLGVREALHEGTNISVLSMDRADYDAAVAAVRARLTPAAFAEAWDLGRATLLEEVIASVPAHNTSI